LTLTEKFLRDYYMHERSRHNFAILRLRAT